MSSVTEFMNQDNANDDDKVCDLTLKQRYIAGGVCMGVGILFSFLSFICFASGDLATFAIIYSIGTVAAVAGSFFIAGPKTHIKALKEIVAHMVSTGVLVAAIVMVFISALAIDSTALAIIFVIVELVALIFFSITLKAMTWNAAKLFFKKIFSCCK